ncbi:MAG: hypothetical protein IKX51_05615, partial [Bacteroidales bacterium]|nr:hypothetical protein [Bacteroidales bacterium]
SNFFPPEQGKGDFPLPLPEKNIFATSFFLKKVAFLIGTYRKREKKMWRIVFYRAISLYKSTI